MKIGILTFHRAINYGAVLQCYALYETLRRKGHDVEVIDYRPIYIEKYRLPFYLNSNNAIHFLKELFRSIILYNKRKKAVKNFNSFLSLLKFSPIVKKAEEISTIDYDLIISGSDQIWNKQITGGRYDDIYWGNFNHDNKKFISYAASFGKISRNEEIDKKLKSLLTHIDAIGVREKDFSDYLNSLGFDTHICVDPTILANKQIFWNLAEEPNEDNYILVYALKNRKKIVSWAKMIQDKTNWDIIVIGGNISYKQNYGEKTKVIQGVSPRLFLGYFLKARIIVNASFHGTVFATLFGKDFYSLKVDNSGRYEQYLQGVGLADRFVEFNYNPSLKPVDYSEFEEKKSKMVKASEDYLKILNI